MQRQRRTIAGWIAALMLSYLFLGPVPFAAAQNAPPAPSSPDEFLDSITKKKAATQLLAEMGPNMPIDTKVARLIDRLVLRDRDQVQAAATALTMLGQPAVPAIIQRMDDRRDMPVGAISFENKSPQAFEGVGHLGVGKVVDGLSLVLNDITGAWFGVVPEPHPDRPEFSTERDAIVAGWRSYLAQRAGRPPVPGKSLPVASPPVPGKSLPAASGS
jgi:hypothetical protein